MEVFVKYSKDYNDIQDKRFPHNKVSTTKYTILTFLPIFLYNQYKRIFNIKRI